MLVDDETRFLNVSKKILELQEPFQVDTAISVKEANEKIRKKEYDVIVSDYQIPIKDGLQFLEELREKGNNTAFILFTGRGREEVAIHALNLGANHYINKIGKPETVYGELVHAIVQEVEKHRSERLLVESEEKYRVLVENAADGVAIIQDKVFKFLNQRLSKMLGYKPEELLGTELLKTISSENRELVMDKYKKRIAGDAVPAVYEIPVLKKNGDKIQVEVNTAFIRYGGKPASMAVIRDITERKKNIEVLENSEEKYRHIVEHLPDAIMTVTMKGTITSVNKVFLDLTGFSEEEVVGKHFTKLGTLRARDVPKYIKFFAGFLRGKLSPVIEFVYYRKDGSRRWGEAHFSFIKKGGRKVGVQGVLMDITERKEAEDELFKESGFMQTLFGAHPDFIYFKDKKARFKRVSGRFCEFLGLDEGEIVGKTDLELFPGEVGEQTYADDLEVIKSGKTLINKEECVNEVWVLTTKMPWLSKRGKIIGLFGISRDITARKKSKEELKIQIKKSRILSEFLSSSEQPFAVGCVDGSLIRINPAFCKLTGYSEKELVGQSDVWTKKLTPEKWRKIETKEFEKLIKTKKPVKYEKEYLTKNGKLIPVELFVQPKFDKEGHLDIVFGFITDITKRKKVEEEIKDMAKFASENPNPVLRIKKDGNLLFLNKAAQTLVSEQQPDKKQQYLNLLQQSVLDCLRSGVPEEVEIRVEDKIFSFVLAPSVKSDYVYVYGRDITGPKKVENALVEAVNELEFVNKKLSIAGKLTRHDVQNKLATAIANIYLAKQTLHSDHEATKYLKETESSIDQIEKIFNVAKLYEKLGVEELSFVDVGKSFERAVSLLGDLGGVEVVNGCGSVVVLADSLLDTLFYNLIDNSLRHGEKVSKIVVCCTTGKDRLKLVYEDDGVGVLEVEKAKIFGEGYGKHSGLGLHIIKLMCDIYGWAIKETGKPSKGVQFTMVIPELNKNGERNYNIN